MGLLTKDDTALNNDEAALIKTRLHWKKFAQDIAVIKGKHFFISTVNDIIMERLHFNTFTWCTCTESQHIPGTATHEYEGPPLMDQVFAFMVPHLCSFFCYNMN